MQPGLLAAVILLFAFANVLLIRVYRAKKLSPRMLRVLLIGLFAAFPSVTAATGLVGDRVDIDKLILASSALGLGAALGTEIGLRWLGPPGPRSSA